MSDRPLQSTELVTVESMPLVKSAPHAMRLAGQERPAERIPEPWDGIKIPCAVVRGLPVFPITSDSILNIAPAFARAQLRFENAKRDSENAGFKTPDGKSNSHYADLASVHAACMTALNSEGIAVNHFTVPIGDDIFLLTRATHASGEWYQGSFPLSTLDSVRQAIADAQKDAPKPAAAGGGLDATGPTEGAAKKKRAPGVQVLGSEITYLRRYCLSALVGVATEDDDNGNAAQAHSNQQPRVATSAPRPARPAGGL